MTLTECYAAFGGDYDEVLQRMMSESFVRKFLYKFLEDGTYAELRSALEQEDCETAFRAAHTMKGICQNLGFEKLYASSSMLTDLLRGGSLAGTEGAQQQVAADYQLTVDAIQTLQKQD